MNYDLIVIGGGPAGMMAAGKSGENGARVLLLEKNPRLGAKLLITGKGRCNITNTEPDRRKFIAHYGEQGKFLFSAFARFDNQAVIDFFESQGAKTKVERGGRVFPVSDHSDTVWSALVGYMNKYKVEIKLKAEVQELVVKNKKIEKVVLVNKEEFVAKKYLITTGGKAYPGTGSTGTAFDWLKKMGHTIITPRPALAPIIVAEEWVKELEGLSLKNVAISIYQNNKKVDSRFGEAIFTSNGLSGPIVLDMSKRIGELLNIGPVELKIDFKPALNEKVLDERIQRDWQATKNKMFKNSLNDLLPQKMIPVVVRFSQIEPGTQVNAVTKPERRKLVSLLKNFTFVVKKVEGFNLAIVTAGGVDLKEVDPKTMRSKIIENLYLAGEILDIDGPTGGFNLQVCWSTGVAAGESAGE